MMFRAKTSIDRTGLRFLFSEWPDALAPPEQSDQSWEWPQIMTYVSRTPVAPEPASGGEEALTNLLGDPNERKDGVISGALTVGGEEKDEMLERLTAVPEGETKTRLYLDPPLVAVEAGKSFDVNVRLDNPNNIPWDRIRLDMLFDPRFLEVEDTDDGNWLTMGVNILDGPYHDRFPFEFMKSNVVRNDSGRILYDCGVFRKQFQSGGTLATIRFKAKKPVPETRIKFFLREEEGYVDGTVLSLRRADVLGDTEILTDGAAGATVVVVPSRELITEGPRDGDARF
jgi:hypothetical protein